MKAIGAVLLIVALLLSVLVVAEILNGGLFGAARGPEGNAYSLALGAQGLAVLICLVVGIQLIKRR